MKWLSNNYFRSRVQYINRLPGDASDNKQLFLNIELLDEAICKGRKVAFEYLSYGTDKQLHPRLRSDGSTDYVVSPYQMAAKEGKYYLICNFDKYDDISNYRMDRIRNIRILDEQAKPFASFAGGGRQLDGFGGLHEKARLYVFQRQLPGNLPGQPGHDRRRD